MGRQGMEWCSVIYTGLNCARMHVTSVFIPWLHLNLRPAKIFQRSIPKQDVARRRPHNNVQGQKQSEVTKSFTDYSPIRLLSIWFYFFKWHNSWGLLTSNPLLASCLQLNGELASSQHRFTTIFQCVFTRARNVCVCVCVRACQIPTPFGPILLWPIFNSCITSAGITPGRCTYIRKY